MKFVKFLSLITIISCAPALYSMEDNTLQEQQSRVPKLIDLCLPGVIERVNAIINEQCAKPNTYEEATDLLKEIDEKFHVSDFADRGLSDKLYRSNAIFQHCIDFIINEIWNQCQDVTGVTLDAIIHEIHQNVSSKLPPELFRFIEVHFCKQKGWHVLYCLKEFNYVDWFRLSPDGSLIFVRYEDRKGELIDAKGKVIKADVGWVDFSPNGSLMFVRYEDRRGELIEVKSGTVIKEFNNVWSANFSPDGLLMFARYSDDTGKLIEVKSGTVIKEFNNVRSVNFSPDGLLMFVRYSDDTGKLIDLKSDAVIKDNVWKVKFSPDGSLMFVEYRRDNNGIYRGELIDAKGEVIKELNNVDLINFSPDGSLIFVWYRNNRGELIDAKSGAVIKDNFNSLEFSPNGSLMFVRYRDEAGNDRGELIDAKTGEVITGFNNKVWDVYFIPDGSLMFVDRNNIGELIEVKSGKVIKEFNNRPLNVYFTLDGSLMVIRYISGKGKLIEVKSGAVIKDNVGWVDFSPDGSLMCVQYLGDKNGNNRGELLCRGNFEQIIFKCALRNTLQMYKKQQSDEIKQGLINLLNHRILTILPEKARDILSKEITDALQDKDDTGFDALVT